MPQPTPSLPLHPKELGPKKRRGGPLLLFSLTTRATSGTRPQTRQSSASYLGFLGCLVLSVVTSGTALKTGSSSSHRHMIDDLFGAPGSTFYAVAPRYWISGRAWRKLRGRGRPTRPAPPPPTAGRVLRLRLVSRAEGRQLWGRGFVRDRWTPRTPENASKVMCYKTFLCREGV